MYISQYVCHSTVSHAWNFSPAWLSKLVYNIHENKTFYDASVQDSKIFCRLRLHMVDSAHFNYPTFIKPWVYRKPCIYAVPHFFPAKDEKTFRYQAISTSFLVCKMKTDATGPAQKVTSFEVGLFEVHKSSLKQKRGRLSDKCLKLSSSLTTRRMWLRWFLGSTNNAAFRRRSHGNY